MKIKAEIAQAHEVSLGIAKNAEIDFIEFNFMNLEDSIKKIYTKLNISN